MSDDNADNFKEDFMFTGNYEEFRQSILIENQTTIQRPQYSSEQVFLPFI